jgi:hypothetical protein
MAHGVLTEYGCGREMTHVDGMLADHRHFLKRGTFQLFFFDLCSSATVKST